MGLVAIFDELVSVETLRAIFVFSGGILATLLGVYFKAYIDQIRWKINNVYRPLYREITESASGDLPFEDGRFTSVWGDFDRAKKEMLDENICEEFNKYAEHLSALNELLFQIEDEIMNDVLNSGGVLPPIMVTSADTPSTVNIVFARSPDGSPRAHTTIPTWINQSGKSLVISQDGEELRKNLIEDADSYLKRQRFREEWTEDCFEGLIELVNKSESVWEKNRAVDGRSDCYEKAVQQGVYIENELENRMRIWRHILGLT